MGKTAFNIPESTKKNKEVNRDGKNAITAISVYDQLR